MNAAARLRTAATASILFATGACALSARPIPVPEALAATEAWTVQMRYDWRSPPRYRIGPYRVENVRHEGIRQRGGVVDAIKGKREYQQRYDYVLRDSVDGGPETRVSCDSRDRDRGFSIGSVDIELDAGRSLECRLSPGADTAAAWALRLDVRDGDDMAGSVERGGARYQIAGQHAVPESDDGLPSAYLVRRDSVLVAMADRTHPGTLRIAPAVPRGERDVIAAALVALLLQQKLIGN